MGQSTVLSVDRVLTPKAPPAGRRRGVDLPLLSAVVVLLLFGLVMMYSASWDYSLRMYNDATYMFVRQLMWLALGIAAAFVVSMLDYHRWRSLIVLAMLATLVLLAAVLFLNEVRLGAARSLFQGSYQPSELAKVVTIVYLAVWLYSKRDSLHDVSLGLIPLGLILGLVGGMIYLQPDLSAAATVLLMGGMLFFLAGGDLKQIAAVILMALVVGFVVVQFSATGQTRVAQFVAGLQDPTQASYHVRRSFEAIVNGGWFGVGLGKAEAKLTGLPVPPTDSIYAVIIEELGLLGGVAVEVLYALIIWRGLVIARRAPDMLGTLIAAGLMLWIAVEAAINMLVMVGMMPFAGNALPFISAGGSNLVSALIAVGILLSISRQRTEESSSLEGTTDSESIDLRGWDRRRRLSGTGSAGSDQS